MLILDEYYPTWMLDAKATLLSIYIHRDIAKSDIQVPVQLGWCLNTVNKYLRILNLSQYKVSSSGKGPWRVQIVNSSVYLPIISNLIAACRSLAAIICCCVHPDLKNTHSQFPLPPSLHVAILRRTFLLKVYILRDSGTAVNCSVHNALDEVQPSSSMKPDW